MKNKMTGHQKRLLQRAEKLLGEIRCLTIEVGKKKPWFVPDKFKADLAGQFLETGMLWLKETIENPSFVEEEVDWCYKNDE